VYAKNLWHPKSAEREGAGIDLPGDGYRTAKLASNKCVVTFACCDQTHCISSGFASGDRIPHLGLCFARWGGYRAIRLTIRRTGSGRENSERGRLCSRPSRV